MVADKSKKAKIEEEQIDGELVLSVEKLQEIQDDLEKVKNPFFAPISPDFSNFLFMCPVLMAFVNFITSKLVFLVQIQ